MLINNLQFTGPYFYDKNFDTTFACVYAIVEGGNLVYVGQTSDINERFSGHHKYDCWKANTSGSERLYILKLQNEGQRLSIESQIVQKYRPVCNG